MADGGREIDGGETGDKTDRRDGSQFEHQKEEAGCYCHCPTLKLAGRQGLSLTVGSTRMLLGPDPTTFLVSNINQLKYSKPLPRLHNQRVNFAYRRDRAIKPNFHPPGQVDNLQGKIYGCCSLPLTACSCSNIHHHQIACHITSLLSNKTKQK